MWLRIHLVFYKLILMWTNIGNVSMAMNMTIRLFIIVDYGVKITWLDTSGSIYKV